MKNNLLHFKSGINDCLPTIFGYWSIGFAAGAIGSISGFSLTDIILLSAFLYAGSAQFLFYSLYASGAGIAAILVAVLLVNIRYLLMSSYMARFFSGASIIEKFISGMLLTDETFGVAVQKSNKNNEIKFWWMLGLNLSAYINWVISNIIGAIFANFIPYSFSQKLGFSLTAMFIGLLALNFFSSNRKGLELTAIIIAFLLIILLNTITNFDSNLLVIISTIISATVCAIILRVNKNEQ
ncbi:AzlC family ABC transporter permease [Salmonella enterica]|uniref:Branched-chain amino acid ABC transporter permease n=1 Tax=Salmonella enterica TaxID=28901 RepID=A0A5T3A599_SALER|nr:branched-chain amino acid ABC transporter permease [Salmonella enterica]ECH9399612.1 branched-chain amino acid ABC transporter permease [Salmonella enterica subsp. diarizonae]EEK9257109.1 AzlC family ABC transporter permease [Salmonella enterica subsp. enterica serovar Typhimurium]SUG60481.1 Inner membrane protein YgaZ [Salmonella enterica subsp. arizonae]EAR5693198.1 branched-chain amino acid ABC transporter permease [Salmonella enterica]